MMDDEDDVDILDDIKALEQALAQESIVLAYESEDDDNETLVHNLSPVRANSPISTPATSTSTAVEYKFDCLYQTIDLAVKANARVLDAYKLALNTVSTRLDECLKRQQEVDYQIHLISRGGRANWRVPYFKAGQPYFKDENSFRATPNDDQLIKQKRDEFPIVYSRLPTKWSPRGRTNLWKAARANASLKYLDLMKSVNRNTEAASDMDYLIPSDFSHILTSLGETELDWMRISVKDMKSRYSWQACKAMWDLHMNPMINRQKWRKDEDNKLKTLAKSHEYQNWDAIALKLGTQRTCYQCFVRYNTINPPSAMSANADAPWSVMENTLVIELVSKLRIGDLIPWTLVTFYLGTRTKNQIYCHWKYNLDPSLKKGRFTSEEDQNLLNAVEKYGKNFPRVASECFPHRSTVQLSNRFHLLMLKTNESYNTWTIADDKRLLALYDEFGNNWSVIGNIMNKDRTYVRHHHAALTRHLSKGIELTRLPRKQITTTDNNGSDNSDIDTRVNENIDVQLIRYFQNIHTPIATPRRKRKYHTIEQLETKTKQLRDVLKKLHCNFEIPDNLDDYSELTEMDKQLLVSLKQCGGINSPRFTPDQIEEYRLKMFRTNKLDNDTEHFIPPAPFGLFQNLRKRSNSRKINGNTIGDSCNLELTMEFETPENIMKMMCDDEIKIFDRFTSLVTKVCKVTQFPGRFEETCRKPLRKINTMSSDYSNSQAGTSQSFAMDNTAKRSNNSFIEPCYSTLVGYQCLLNMLKTYNGLIPNESTISERMSEDGRQAFRLLKNRFATLFKYPIGLARVPMASHIMNDYNDEENNDDIADTEESEVPIPEANLSKTPTSPSEAGDNKLTTGENVEVSTPVRLSLNMIKTLRGKRKEKIHKSTHPNNEL